MKLNRLMWKMAISAVVITGLPLFAAEHNTKENRGQLGYRDYRFLMEAAQGGMMEVRLGELAKQKATTPSVREFAEKMITDHSKANDELKQIASTKGAVVPSELSHRENATIERFEKLSGREFEKEYVEHMVKDHKKDAKDFEDAVKDVKDPELKAFAQKTLSVIQQHLRSVQDLQNSVKS